MVMRDLYSDVKVTQAVKPQLNTGNGTTITGDIIDTADYESVAFAFNVGTAGDTWSGSLYATVKLYADDAAAMGTEAEVTTAALGLLGTMPVLDLAADHQAKAYKFGYNGSKRYLRVKVVNTGNHAVGTPMGCTAVQGHARANPVA